MSGWLPIGWVRRASKRASGVFACAMFLASAGTLSAQILPKKPAPLELPQGTGACSIEKSCAEVAPEIIRSAMGLSPLKENLRYLTQTIGPRLTGSDAADKAAGWAVEAFQHAGVDEVKTEQFTIPVRWRAGRASARVVSPAAFPIRLVSTGWSPATPAGGITARILDVGDGDDAEFAKAGAAVKDAIILVHSNLARDARNIEEEGDRAASVIDLAQKAGVAAILWMSDRPGATLYRQTSTMAGRPEALPQAVVAREDAEHVARLLSEGRHVRAHLDMPNVAGGTAESENVVAEIRGRDKPDEFVLVAAQLDSWDLGKGALDDGCNAAMLIDAARAVHSAGTIPHRSIRFVLFTGQEQGMLGSWAYMRAHRGELDQMAAAIVFAEGNGRISGYSLNGRRDALAAVSTALDPIRSLGVTNFTLAPQPLSNALDFVLEGVPTLVPVAEPGRNALDLRTAADTFDKVDIQELKRRSAVAAVTAFALADSESAIGARQPRSEIEQLLEDTGLAEKMKLDGSWWQWQTAQRGRQP